MNKKGDIPITILVIGVFAICGLAIFSFYISDSKIKEDFVNTELIEKINSFAEEIAFYKNLGKDPMQEMEIFDSEFKTGYQISYMVFKGDKNARYIEGGLIENKKRILFVKYNFNN